MISKIWTVILPLIGVILSLIALPLVRSTSEERLVKQDDCLSAVASNETQGPICDQTEGSCTGRAYNPEEDELITEASYTPPLNHTYPAPKTAQGLGSDMGEPQELDATYSEEIFARIEKSREYMHSKVMVEERYEDVRSICQNQHASCTFWSVLGECENNPAYMHVHCAPVCETCEVRNLGFRSFLEMPPQHAR